MPPTTIEQQQPTPPVAQVEHKTITQKIARFFYYLTIICTVVTGIALIPKAGLTLFGTLFALADAAGAPNSTGFGLLDVARDFVTFLWISGAPLLELLGVLVVSLAITHVLYKKRFYTWASIAAVVLLVVAVPFARAAIYFSMSGASLPLSVPGVDTLTYKTLSTNSRVEGRYSLDKNHVYCSNQILPNADPATFAIIPGQGKTTGFADYARDANYVWFACTQISDADPATFAMVGSSVQADSGWADAFAKDSHVVYFQGTAISGADPTSFVILTDNYAKDKNHVYIATTIMQGADPATFQIVNNPSICYANQDPNCPPDAKDSKQLYLHGQVIGQVH